MLDAVRNSINGDSSHHWEEITTTDEMAKKIAAEAEIDAFEEATRSAYLF